MVNHWIKLGLFALALVGGTAANAAFTVPDVVIERAVNGQSINVRFTQVAARLVELRVNGISVGTRAVNGAEANEVKFRTDATTLNDGKNLIEVLVFDGDGNLLETQKSNLDVEAPTNTDVEISSPKAGSTIQGLVDIRVALKNSLRVRMVSFIVDGDMRSMTNVAPYQYVIDTEMLTNGWHEVQILVVDESNRSARSRKVRVFVNNPGGRTDRVGVPTAPVVPVVSDVPLATMSGGYAAVLAKPAPAKPMKVQAPTASTTGARSLTPTGRRVATPKPVAKPAPKPVAKPSAKPVRVAPLPAIATAKPPVQAKPAPVAQANTAAATIRIAHGTRLNLSVTLSLTYDARTLRLDVPARVQEGIALSPFRHLYEAAGGKVKWTHEDKTVNANGAARNATVKIGSKTALLNGQKTTLEYAAFIDHGRTIVPLSFISDTLNVNVDVDPKTGHVLITKRSK
ncbi:MAG: hypothetical protein IT206_06230 [Fimbriimonadaceae bacterium]|nr:hypothetical protein [Fimbriimonadaceae bacterium]